MSSDKGKQILEKLRAVRGFTLPHHEILAKDYPDYLEQLLNYTSVLEREGALSAKMKQLIIIALDSSSRFEVGVKAHVKRAVELGATRAEVLEAVCLATNASLTAISIIPVVDQALRDMKK